MREGMEIGMGVSYVRGIGREGKIWDGGGKKKKSVEMGGGICVANRSLETGFVFWGSAGIGCGSGWRVDWNVGWDGDGEWRGRGVEILGWHGRSGAAMGMGFSGDR
jgi:hypothetical protein